MTKTIREVTPQNAPDPTLSQATSVLLYVLKGIEFTHGPAVALNAAISAYLSMALDKGQGVEAAEIMFETAQKMPDLILDHSRASCVGSA